MSMQPEPDISVCIVTYRRPSSLARLLGCLARQEGALPAFEILVVDNDVERTAAEVCRRFEGCLPVRYAVEARRGISHARNRSVEASCGRYIAYVDDDHEVGPEWLAGLHAAAVASGADGVFGPVIVNVEGELPAWVRSADFFTYRPLVPCAPIPWHRTRTANCCLRRAALPGPAPFDPRLALTGGEDTELFERMIRSGARLISIPAPAIQDRRPAARANALWLLRRSFRIGGTGAYVEWRGLGRTVRLRYGTAALVISARELARALTAVGRSRAEAFARLLSATEALGRAAHTIGFMYPEYARPA
jgi:succinoglycan biosynthesis protein ExoM